MTARTPQYTSITDFSQLYSRQQRDISASTPGFNTTQANLYLTRAEDQVDDYCRRTWLTSKTMVAPDGTGLLQNLIPCRWVYRGYYASFEVPLGPIQSITKLELFTGGTGYTDVTSSVNNENRPTGIWFDPNGTEVFIGGGIALPWLGRNGARIQYIAGINATNTPIPGEVTEATLLLAAYMYAQSEAWFFQVPAGTNRPHPVDLAVRWKDRAYDILQPHRRFVIA